MLEISTRGYRSGHKWKWADAVPELSLRCKWSLDVLVGLDSLLVRPRLLHRNSLEPLCPGGIHLIATVDVPIVNMKEIILPGGIVLQPPK
jgi:hypothetical protein